jgi:hypothetical protein
LGGNFAGKLENPLKLSLRSVKSKKELQSGMAPDK